MVGLSPLACSRSLVDDLLDAATSHGGRAVRPRAVVEARPHQLSEGAVHRDVAVGLDETRHDDVLGVTQVRLEDPVAQRLDDLAIGADVQDPVPAHRDRLGARAVGVQGDYLASSIDGDGHGIPLRIFIPNVADCQLPGELDRLREYWGMTNVSSDRRGELKRPSQARSIATFASILDASTDIIVERGVQGLNTNIVAERAGVNIGTVYHYFPDKTAILVELFRIDQARRMAHLLEKLREVSETPDLNSVGRRCLHARDRTEERSPRDGAPATGLPARFPSSWNSTARRPTSTSSSSPRS